MSDTLIVVIDGRMYLTQGTHFEVTGNGTLFVTRKTGEGVQFVGTYATGKWDRVLSTNEVSTPQKPYHLGPSL